MQKLKSAVSSIVVFSIMLTGASRLRMMIRCKCTISMADFLFHNTGDARTCCLGF